MCLESPWHEGDPRRPASSVQLFFRVGSSRLFEELPRELQEPYRRLKANRPAFFGQLRGDCPGSIGDHQPMVAGEGEFRPCTRLELAPVRPAETRLRAGGLRVEGLWLLCQCEGSAQTIFRSTEHTRRLPWVRRALEYGHVGAQHIEAMRSAITEHPRLVLAPRPARRSRTARG